MNDIYHGYTEPDYFLYAYIIAQDKYEHKGNDKIMAKDGFSLNGIVSNAASSLVGKPSGIINKLAAGDRESAIGILLGEEVPDDPQDWRVRLSIAPGAEYLYGDDGNRIMSRLKETNGVVWPYTPDITMSYTARYSKTEPAHSNYPIHTYQNSEVSTITIAGDMTAQTPSEARYLLACMMFLRASTKMFWGSDEEAGMPPPVLYLNGYGAHFLPNIPVVVTSYTANLPSEVDYIEAFVQESAASNAGFFDNSKLSKLLTRIPASVSMAISVEPVYSRLKVAEEFNFKDFARGNLIAGKGRGGGGFI